MCRFADRDAAQDGPQEDPLCRPHRETNSRRGKSGYDALAPIMVLLLVIAMPLMILVMALHENDMMTVSVLVMWR
jgi:hypothetical protein